MATQSRMSETTAKKMAQMKTVMVKTGKRVDG